MRPPAPRTTRAEPAMLTCQENEGAAALVEESRSRTPTRQFSEPERASYTCPLCTANVVIQLCSRAGHVMHGCSYVEVSTDSFMRRSHEPG